MTSLGPRLFTVLRDIPGVADAGSYLWYDPTVNPPVRVVSFPHATPGTIEKLVSTGGLDEWTSVEAPRLGDHQGDFTTGHRRTVVTRRILALVK